MTPGAGGTYTESVLHSFAGVTTDGAYPIAGLTFGAKGALYGTTQSGGSSSCAYAPMGSATGCGTVFKLTPVAGGGTYTESILYSFTGGGDGSFPYAALFWPAKRVFFGTTQSGGVFGGGTAFQLNVK
jgi:hypothetical protein